jgi:DNA-binding LacI/PurR family transcriptional regulator
MDHLWERGYRRISYLYPWTDLQPIDSRYSVYEAICAQRGQPAERLYLEPLETQNRLYSVTQAGLREAGLKTGLTLAARPPQERPDALVCHNDLVAIGVFHGLRRGGVRIPKDMAIVGFDGIEEGLYLDKPLTTVVSPGSLLIETAFHILARRLETSNGSALPPQQITLPSVLRAGQTT